MVTSDAPGALALLFILMMVWFRTRLRYPRPAGGRLRLTRTGMGYFALLVVLLATGWVAAPLLAQHFGVAALRSETLARAGWALAVYAGCIPLHRALLVRGLPVFRAVERGR